MSVNLTQEQIHKEFGWAWPDHKSALNRLDVVHGFKWDSLSYVAGSTLTRYNSDMFRVPVGLESLTGSGAKLMADTNLYSACKLDAPEMMAVKCIIFTFSKSCDERDLYHFLESYMFRFWMGQKMYSSAVLISLPTVTTPLAPIRICEYCRSVYANQSECPRCGATDFTLSSLGESDNGLQYVMDLNVNLVIANQMSFHLDFDGPNYTFLRNFKMWCHLEGLHARGVQ